MLKMTAFYEAKAHAVVGRPIEHVLLLHMNDAIKPPKP
jgi:hypothetical protein